MDIDLVKRKPMRLKDYDYSQSGVYFVTICVKGRRPLLWNVGATCGRPSLDAHHLSDYGRMIDVEIKKINTIYESVRIDTYVIMPNHIHMIIMLETQEGGRPQVAPTISRVIQQFKGSISKQIGVSIWQKLFHDHIIRNEAEYLKIWEYIHTNPLKWADDCYYVP